NLFKIPVQTSAKRVRPSRAPRAPPPANNARSSAPSWPSSGSGGPGRRRGRLRGRGSRVLVGAEVRPRLERKVLPGAALGPGGPGHAVRGRAVLRPLPSPRARRPRPRGETRPRGSRTRFTPARFRGLIVRPVLVPLVFPAVKKLHPRKLERDVRPNQIPPGLHSEHSDDLKKILVPIVTKLMCPWQEGEHPEV
uniref:Uncharacterized protein n=1 Tax=Mustela putorius furo TaxID=9669 RepID=M3YL06_MUSPF